MDVAGKQTLLLVDGDPKSQRVLAVSLRKAGFQLTAVGNATEALALLERGLPDLIISDTQLPGVDGFELCRRLKQRADWAKIPFIFLAANKGLGDKIRGLELGVEDYLTKPVYIREILTRVRMLLQRQQRERLEAGRPTSPQRTKFVGQLADINLVDLVQTIEVNRKSGIIHLANRDRRRGTVYFRDGKVIDAEVARLGGADAVYRLFSWSDGDFEVDFKAVRRKDVIELSSQQLLMEGMHRLDEWARLLETAPPLDSIFEVDYRLLAERLSDIPDEVNGILRLFDGRRTLGQVIDDCDFADLEALPIAARLQGEGLLYDTQRVEEDDAVPEIAGWLAAPSGAIAAPPYDGREKEEEGEPPDAAATPAAWPPGRSTSPYELLGELPPRVTVPPEAGVPAAAMPPAPWAPAAAAPAQPPAPSVPLPAFTQTLPPPMTAGPAAPAPVPAVPVETPPPVASPADPRGPAEQPADEAGGAAAEWDDLAGVAAGSAARARGLDPGNIIQFPQYAPRGTIRPSGGAVPVVTGAVAGEVRVTKQAPSVAPEPPLPVAASPVPPQESMASEAPPLPAPQPRTLPGVGAMAHGVDPRAPTEGSVPVPIAPPTRLRSDPNMQRPSRAGPDSFDDLELPKSRKSLGIVAALIAAVAVVAGILLLRGGDEAVVSDAKVAPPRPAKPAPPATPPQIAEPSAPPAAVAPPEPPAVAAAGGGPIASPPAVAAAAAPPPAAPAVAVAGKPGPRGAASRASPADNPPAADKPAAAAKADKVPAAKSAATDASAEKAPAPERAGPSSSAASDAVRDCRQAYKRSHKQAAAACPKALEAAPGSAEIMVILANVELDRGKNTEALSWAERAIAADPRFADAYLVTGAVQQEKGRNADAKAAYHKYLQFAPKGKYAEDVRAILSGM